MFSCWAYNKLINWVCQEKSEIIFNPIINTSKTILMCEKIFLAFSKWSCYVKNMKLNIIKIENELKRLDKSWFWISKELDMSWQRVRYWKKTKSIKGAEPIAKLFNIEPKDLIL